MARPAVDQRSPIEQLMSHAEKLAIETLKDSKDDAKNEDDSKDDVKEEATPFGINALSPRMSRSSSCIDAYTTATIDEKTDTVPTLPSKSRAKSMILCSAPRPISKDIKGAILGTDPKYTVAQSHFARQCFMYCLEQLLCIHCQRFVLARLNAEAKDDDIYD